MTATSISNCIRLHVAVCLSVPSLTMGGVVEFDDKAAWIAAVGTFRTVDFTKFPVNTFVTDQYADFGVLFTDGDDVISFGETVYPEDGFGLDGNGNITLSFDTPQAWIAADFAGRLRIELYSDGQLSYTTDIFAVAGGYGNFGGLISTDLFDMAVLMDVPAEFEAEIDNLYFGVPAPNALALLSLAALSRGRRRRKISESMPAELHVS